MLDTDHINDARPCISVIVPVLNETLTVNALIEHLRSLSAPGPVEIIVVDGDPEACTLNVIEDKGVITAVSGGGRAGQMNAGAELATGEVLLFLHADTRLPEQAFHLLAGALADGKHVAGAFAISFDSHHFWMKATSFMANRRNKITRTPFGDQALFFRRDSFQEIGGYASIPIMEDVEIMRRIKKRGDAIVLLPEAVVTSARRWHKEGMYFVTLRNWSLQVLFAWGVSAEKLATMYRAHKEEQ
jgi:rSAM/selenodomain-associated transferase 2